MLPPRTATADFPVLRTFTPISTCSQVTTIHIIIKQKKATILPPPFTIIAADFTDSHRYKTIYDSLYVKND